MKTYSIEIKCRGTTIKYVTAKAPTPLQAIDNISGLYPVGPYEFVAREMDNVSQ